MKLSEKIIGMKASAKKNFTSQDFYTNKTVFENVDLKWNWKVELLLLESIEVHGLFSWIKISNLLTNETGVKFTEQEIHDHFYQCYLEGTLGQVWNYQLVKNPVVYIDHTEDEPADKSSLDKYLPLVSTEDLKDIKFLPHRDEFEVYPQEASELMVTQLDFSSFYLTNLANLKIGDEVKDLQLAIVDSYRRKVGERIALRKFMKDFKLIEQYFFSRPLQSNFFIKKSACILDADFKKMKKFIYLFDTSNEFLDFYYGCVKERLIKLEIIRLAQSVENKKKVESLKERNLETNTLLKKRAPDCFCILTKILSYTEEEGKKGSLNLLEERDLGKIKWINSHQLLLEGLRQHKLQLENHDD